MATETSTVEVGTATAISHVRRLPGSTMTTNMLRLMTLTFLVLLPGGLLVLAAYMLARTIARQMRLEQGTNGHRFARAVTDMESDRAALITESHDRAGGGWAPPLTTGSATMPETRIPISAQRPRPLGMAAASSDAVIIRHGSHVAGAALLRDTPAHRER